VGLVTVHLGDEAVLDLDRFSLEGRAVRIARQSWHRGRRAGYSSLVCRSRDLEPDQVAKLVELSRRWRAGAVERGFSMALGRLLDPGDPGTLVVAASDGDRRRRGFLHLVPWGADGASLDVMRRDRAAPSWLSDFLVVEAARRLPELGVRRLARWLLRRLSSLFQIESLYRFNRKLAPDWQPRYLALEAPEALPQVALTTLRAEGLLHPPWRFRGRRPGRSASG
jgi:lysyl-tRNA synthetase, class II